MLTPLGQFIADLATDPQLQSDYKSRPESVLASRGLSEDEIQCLTNPDARDIGQLLAKQMGIEVAAEQLLDSKYVVTDPRSLIDTPQEQL